MRAEGSPIVTNEGMRDPEKKKPLQQTGRSGF
jgi:hypothetical protein